MDTHDSPPLEVRLITLQFSVALAGFDARPLETLLADKEVLAVREHFFSVAGTPYVACLLTCRVRRDPPGPEHERDAPPPAARRARIDLDDGERALYETLRRWRRERAHAEGVPPYVLFNNRELAGIVRARPRTRTALLALPGVGAHKVERYGADLLGLCGGEIAEVVA